MRPPPPAFSTTSNRSLQRIGEGGTGEVYEAEQTCPIRRRVALKVIKWGMDTKEVLARFESERQALALRPRFHREFVSSGASPLWFLRVVFTPAGWSQQTLSGFGRSP